MTAINKDFDTCNTNEEHYGATFNPESKGMILANHLGNLAAQTSNACVLALPECYLVIGGTVVSGDFEFDNITAYVRDEDRATAEFNPLKMRRTQAFKTTRVKVHPSRAKAIQEALGVRGEVVEHTHRLGGRWIRVSNKDVAVYVTQSREMYMKSCGY